MNNEQVRQVVSALLTHDMEVIAETLQNLSTSISVEIKRMLFDVSEAGGLALGRDKRTNRFGIFQSRFDPPLSFDQAATILASHLVDGSVGELESRRSR